MKAPNKFYVNVVAAQRQYDVTLETTEPRDGFQYIEYIRKGVLLEELEKLRANTQDDAKKAALERLINKVQSL